MGVDRKTKVAFRKLVTISFACGIVVAISINALIQDYFGLEGYIQHCREHWLSPWIAVPWALVMLVIAILGQSFVRAVATQCDKLSSEKDDRVR